MKFFLICSIIIYAAFADFPRWDGRVVTNQLDTSGDLVTDLCTLDTVECVGQRKIYATITAYTASADETDADFCTSASGMDVCKTSERVVANNCLAFGTKVTIDGVEYTVQDRGAKRHGCQWYDVLMRSKKEARNWGRRVKLVTIYE